MRPRTQTCLADEQITLADLLIAPHLDFLAQTPEWIALTAATPNLMTRLRDSLNRDDDLAELLIRLEVPVRRHDVVQREGFGDHRLQMSLRET